MTGDRTYGQRPKAIFRPITTAPAPMQTPSTILGLNLIESSSASKYRIRPADDWRPRPSFFFLAMLQSYPIIILRRLRFRPAAIMQIRNGLGQQSMLPASH